MQEPSVKRAVAFVDGQNLYRHVKDAFGHHYPNYDLKSLFTAVCANQAWQAQGVRFYTGVPLEAWAAMWNGYWNNRLLAMRRAGVSVTRRDIRCHDKTVDH